MRSLWFATYNCLSLRSPLRLQEIAAELKTDFTVLVGTCRRAFDERDHIVETLPQGFAVHFDWESGSKWTTNKAGCSIIVGKGYTTRDLIKVEAAPKALRGRGGMIRLRTATKDITIMAAYPPPLYTDKGKAKTAAAAADATMRMLFRWIKSTPRRSLPLVGIDVNSPLGTTSFGEEAPANMMGIYNTGKQNTTGDQLTTYLKVLNMSVAGSYWPQGGPTYFHHTGSCSTIDHILVPNWFLPNIEHLTVAWRSGRRLQQIPSGMPRDHLPIIMKFRYNLLEQFSAAPPPKITWSFDKLAEALQFGGKRQDFLEELEEKMVQEKASFAEVAHETDPDKHWRLWVKLVKDTGLNHFSRDKKDKEKDNMKKKKKKLLQQRADRRTEAAEFYDDYKEWQGYDEEHLHALEEIRRIDKELRRRSRWERALRNMRLEDALEEAISQRRAAEIWRLAYALAGKATGPRKRIWKNCRQSSQTKRA